MRKAAKRGAVIAKNRFVEVGAWISRNIESQKGKVMGRKIGLEGVNIVGYCLFCVILSLLKYIGKKVR